uniref:Uncharacterized protein n=1 Tax=Arundo donax TaxID=35708 RepID=A0A0A9E4W0_ARUDO
MVLSHPTSSCECGTRCTFSFPATTVAAPTLALAAAIANADATLAAACVGASATSSSSIGNIDAMACAVLRGAERSVE